MDNPLFRVCSRCPKALSAHNRSGVCRTCQRDPAYRRGQSARRAADPARLLGEAARVAAGRPTRAERYRQYVAAGLCGCGREPRPGGRRCRGCVEASRRYRRKHARAGLCACGRDRAPGRLLCPACLSRQAARDQANLARGLCRCGRKPKPGCVCCTRCITRAIRVKQRKGAA